MLLTLRKRLTSTPNWGSSRIRRLTSDWRHCDLQTSLDLRIPDAMRPLLSDEGNSIRRLAARAIGSRWWQIAKERVPEFVTALQRNNSTEFEDEKNMIDRAVGLLTREYNGDMFARSANKRWVVYERRALPCLIDTQTGTEELLGWPRDESAGLQLLLSALGNSTLKDCATWHPTKEAVAFSVLESRRAAMLWVWQHRVGLRKLARTDIMNVLRLKEPIDEPNPVTAELKEWKADELYVAVGYGREGEAVLAWNPSKNMLRVVSGNR
jgi:hypothetical protein